jgi:hypothetical protein
VPSTEDTIEPPERAGVLQRPRAWTVKGSALPVTWDDAIERLMSSSATPRPGAP